MYKEGFAKFLKKIFTFKDAIMLPFFENENFAECAMNASAAKFVDFLVLTF